MNKQEQQRPLIARGTILEWSEHKLRVLKIGRVFVQCRTLDGALTMNVPRRELESATVLTEESELP